MTIKSNLAFNKRLKRKRIDDIILYTDLPSNENREDVLLGSNKSRSA